jgi:hypothetical protein
VSQSLAFHRLEYVSDARQQRERGDRRASAAVRLPDERGAHDGIHPDRQSAPACGATVLPGTVPSLAANGPGESTVRPKA